MGIYTKGGDKGETSLVGGTRVQKSHIRVEAYGSIDELVSFLGVIRSYDIDQHYQEMLFRIQDRLMLCAALLASDGTSKKEIPNIAPEDIALLEREIDTMDASIPQLHSFVLPGGSLPASFCHVSSGVCRRAERAAVRLATEYPVSENCMVYLNRLSDYLFTLGRKIAKDFNKQENLWIVK